MLVFSLAALVAMCAMEASALTRRQNFNWDFALYVERYATDHAESAAASNKKNLTYKNTI
jgi:hypothetical protein